MNPWLALLICVISAGIGFLMLFNISPPVLLGMTETGHSEVVRMLAGFAATILGVILGAAYRELRQRHAAGKRRVDIGRFFKDLRSSIELWLGLLGAPVVFALLLNTTEGVDTGGLVVIALQNGFCCLVILNAFMEKREGEAVTA